MSSAWGNSWGQSWGDSWGELEAFKTGTGGIDPQRRYTIKPTGLLDRPRKARKEVEDRVAESAVVQAEVSAKLREEFLDPEIQRAAPIEKMSIAEIDKEIKALLQKKMRTEDEETMLVMLMIAVAV